MTHETAFNYDTDAYIVESVHISERSVNDAIIHSVGRQLLDGSFRDF